MGDAHLATYIRDLIQEDKLYKFYKSNDWIALRDEVLRENHYECAHCLANGIYQRAVMVHHVNEVRKHPALALTKEIIDPITGEKKKNLVPLCFKCHEMEHDRFGDYKREKDSEKFTNDERW